ncbi:MAG: sterol desaturase family protein [Deltaproteobacteria bacterium]|nr:sterol desaturase family protein [Deltaproteobacteria bacterium]MBW2448383.1 sterol desaturase family protein [Deltaproteobacteria bacterium]
MACAIERTWPRRPFKYGVFTRWSSNGGMLVTNMLMVRTVFASGGTVGMAYYCAENEIGLLNLVDVPQVVAFPLAMLGIDFVMWFQHRLLHQFGFLWRAHQVHHSDLDLTTALRFHPFEAFFTVLMRLGAVAIFGTPILAVAAYEILLEALDTLGHAAVRIPTRVDAVLRWVHVTPDYHRVHHSAAPEMNRNYALIFTLWDRLFGTYQAQPEKGHLKMKLGLPDRREAPTLHYFSLLLLPFRSMRQG